MNDDSAAPTGPLSSAPPHNPLIDKDASAEPPVGILSDRLVFAPDDVDLSRSPMAGKLRRKPSCSAPSIRV